VKIWNRSVSSLENLKNTNSCNLLLCCFFKVYWICKVFFHSRLIVNHVFHSVFLSPMGGRLGGAFFPHALGAILPPRRCKSMLGTTHTINPLCCDGERNKFGLCRSSTCSPRGTLHQLQLSSDIYPYQLLTHSLSSFWLPQQWFRDDPILATTYMFGQLFSRDFHVRSTITVTTTVWCVSKVCLNQ